jgi:hypothetical protein
MESEMLGHPAGKTIWSKFRIVFRGLDYEEIFRNLWASVWVKILNLLLERIS